MVEQLGAGPDGAIFEPLPPPASAAVAAGCAAATAPAGPTCQAAVLRAVRRGSAVASAGQTGAWIWRQDTWTGDPAGLIRRLRGFGFDTVYVAVPISPAGAVTGAAALARLVRLARKAGIAVGAVEGDPEALLPGGQASFLRRTRALVTYNTTVRPAERLTGVQYDIEPYLLPGFALQPDYWLGVYARLVLALKTVAAGMPVELVVPFWLRGNPGGDSALGTVAPAIDRLITMIYRTDPAQVEALAAPLLAWGRLHRRPVSLALEFGQTPDERVTTFLPAPTGSLWGVPIAGRMALVLLGGAAANPFGPALAASGTRIVSGRTISFGGDTKALAAAVAQLRSSLGASAAFGGVDVDGYF